MFKKINISSYLRPRRDADTDEPSSHNADPGRPKHDPSYSVLLGYGFSGMPKLLPPDPNPDRKER